MCALRCRRVRGGQQAAGSRRCQVTRLERSARRSASAPHTLPPGPAAVVLGRALPCCSKGCWQASPHATRPPASSCSPPPPPPPSPLRSPSRLPWTRHAIRVGASTTRTRCVPTRRLLRAASCPRGTCHSPCSLPRPSARRSNSSCSARAASAARRLGPPTSVVVAGSGPERRQPSQALLPRSAPPLRSLSRSTSASPMPASCALPSALTASWSSTTHSVWQASSLPRISPSAYVLLPALPSAQAALTELVAPSGCSART